MTFNWGTGMAAIYALFVVSTVAFVTFAMRRPVALVRADYYAESLRQDQKCSRSAMPAASEIAWR